MADFVYSDNNTNGFFMDESGKSWLIKKGAIIFGQVQAATQSTGVSLTINGTLAAGEAEVLDINSASATVIVGATGQVAGNAISFAGSDALFRIDGTVVTDDIALDGANGRLENFGQLDGGITITGAGSSVLNAKGGVINEGSTAIRVDTATGIVTKITSFGLIDSAVGIIGGDGIENIRIRGEIQGGIRTFDGDDTIDVRNARVHGDIFAGEGSDRIDLRGFKPLSDGRYRGDGGDDTFLVSSASFDLLESAGGGIDTVISTVNYALGAEFEKLMLTGQKNLRGTGNELANTLFGNAGDNRLRGLDGDDTFFSGKGNDRMTGGAGEDTFAFETGDGVDVITDFTPGEDQIDLSNWTAIRSQTDLERNHLFQRNGNVEIVHGKDKLVLLGVGIGELASTDFDI